MLCHTPRINSSIIFGLRLAKTIYFEDNKQNHIIPKRNHENYF
jgi:hypothetical protein